MPKTYQVTAHVNFDRVHHCSYCGCDFSYPMDKNFNATDTVQEKAVSKMDKMIGTTLQKETKMVPCPQCGRYQPEMVIWRFRDVSHPGCVAIGPLVVMSISMILFLFFPDIYSELMETIIGPKGTDFGIPIFSCFIWGAVLCLLLWWKAVTVHSVNEKDLNVNIQKANNLRAKLLSEKDLVKINFFQENDSAAEFIPAAENAGITNQSPEIPTADPVSPADSQNQNIAQAGQTANQSFDEYPGAIENGDVANDNLAENQYAGCPESYQGIPADNNITFSGFSDPFYLILPTMIFLTTIDLAGIFFYIRNTVVIMGNADLTMMDRWVVLTNGWYFIPAIILLVLFAANIIASILIMIYCALIRKEIEKVKHLEKTVGFINKA